MNRRMIFILLVLLVNTASLAQEPKSPPAHYALLIGISQHSQESKNLRYAHRDAEKLKEALLDPDIGGWESSSVALLTNQEATYENIQKALRKWKQARPELLLVYFSCQGKRENDEYFLLAYDKKLAINDLFHGIKEVQAKHTLVFNDACRSGVSPLNLQAKPLLEVPALAIFYAAQAGEDASEVEELEGSLFTHYLIDAMQTKRNEQGKLPIEAIIDHISTEVHAWCKKNPPHSQTPSYLASEDFPALYSISLSPPLAIADSVLQANFAGSVPREILVSNQGRLRLLNILGSRCFKHSGSVTSVGFSPDGKLALSGSEDKTLKLWEVESGRELRTFSGHQDAVTSVAISPDGKFAFSGSWDNTLKLWEIETSQELDSIVCDGLPTCVQFSALHHLILVGNGNLTLTLYSWK